LQRADFFVSRYWWLRYCMFSVPGPITNADIICDHGALKMPLAESAANLVVALTQKQYEALAAAYGAAESPLRKLTPCQPCQLEAQLLGLRRQRERDAINAVDSTTLPSGGGVDGDAEERCGTRGRRRQQRRRLHPLA